MAYIGRSPEYGNAVSQQITGTNSAGPYTLSYDTSTSGVVISLDGVVQRNSVDFNIAGTALTFTSTVGTGIIINVIFTGLTLSFPTPSDGSVTDAKIVDMAATKLTGTIADARFPATLPATSGVNLTALNATNLGSGTVPTARLGSGTASSSTFLRGDQTYAEAGGGKLLSFVHTVKTDSYTTSTTGSWVDVTGLSVTTGALASTGSKVLVQVTMNVGCPGDYSSARVVDGSGNIITGFVGDAASSRTRGSLGTFYRGADGGTVTQVNLTTSLYDSPSSTSAQTYKVQTFSGAAIYVNRSSGDSDGTAHTRSVSSISAMEISA